MLQRLLEVIRRAISAVKPFWSVPPAMPGRRGALHIAAGAAAAMLGGCISLMGAPAPPPPPPPAPPPPPPPPALGHALGEPGEEKVDPGPADPLPSFGPIPQWSVSRAFSSSARARFLRLAGLSNPSLFDVGDRLAEIFAAAGYSDYGFYRVDGGFAMAARLEMINDDGTPSRPARFISPRDPQPFGFAGFLGQLLFGEDGFYRVIVMVVSDLAVTPQGGPPTVRRAEAWFTHAAAALPTSYTRRPFTPAHSLTALVYEFRKTAGPEETAVVPVTRLTSQQHLNGAGVSRRLGLA